jgi:hypothetical protein
MDKHGYAACGGGCVNHSNNRQNIGSMFVFENADIRNLVKTRLLDLSEIVAFERYCPWNFD